MLQILLLSIRVHLDALKLDPHVFLQGLVWRCQGLKVRSRNRISALAGRSPHAYPLWIARDESRLFAALPRLDAASLRSIRPVIDCRLNSEGLEESLHSLSRARCPVPPVIIGPIAAPGTLTIQHPSELAGLIDEGGQWLLPLTCGDRVAKRALDAYLDAAESEPARPAVAYADDDLIGGSVKRAHPHFKPDWNPDLFQSHDFISGAAIVWGDRKVLAKLPDRDWAEWLVRRAVAGRKRPLHVPLILHHRRARPAPTIPDKPSLRLLKDPPEVTVIVPTRNHAKLLQMCLAGIARTDYPRLSTLIIDNGSDDRETLELLAEREREGMTILHLPGPFNYSALNNAAVARTNSDLLCFLNNDVEMVDDDWLGLLVRHAVRPDIGAVGARLLYPDGTIQHAGVVTGVGGGAGHGHRLQSGRDHGYFSRANLPQQVSAVTAACLVVKRDKFLAVGGFDEIDFPVAFNDVDLCLKLNARGWQAFYEPRATLIHHESKSRGTDTEGAARRRFAGELAALKRKWRTDELRDPFHHPQLSRFCEQFLVAL